MAKIFFKLWYHIILKADICILLGLDVFIVLETADFFQL